PRRTAGGSATPLCGSRVDPPGARRSPGPSRLPAGTHALAGGARRTGECRSGGAGTPGTVLRNPGEPCHVVVDDAGRLRERQMEELTVLADAVVGEKGVNVRFDTVGVGDRPRTADAPGDDHTGRGVDLLGPGQRITVGVTDLEHLG